MKGLKPMSKSQAAKARELLPGLLVLGAFAVGAAGAGVAWGWEGTLGYLGLWAAACWLESNLETHPSDAELGE
jgi:hypothetical protein